MPYVEIEPLANTMGHPAVTAARASSDAASAKTTCTHAGEDRSMTEEEKILIFYYCWCATEAKHCSALEGCNMNKVIYFLTYLNLALPMELVPNYTLMFVWLHE